MSFGSALLVSGLAATGALDIYIYVRICMRVGVQGLGHVVGRRFWLKSGSAAD